MSRAKPSWAILTSLIVLLLSCSVRAESPGTAAPTAEETRQAFLKMIDRPRVELAPEVKEEMSDGVITSFHFTYSSEANERVPGVLRIKQELLKDGHRHPAAIILHGTGGSKASELAILKKLAEKGFVAVAIDGRYHGERGTQADYNAAIAKAFADGGSHPLYYDTVWDVMRLVDYLQTRPDVDPARIGLMGISKGGIETWLGAAVDQRIAVAIPCISLQSFKWALENDAWHQRIGTVKKGFDAAAKSAGVATPDAAFVRQFYDRVIPGIYEYFDAPTMLTLIAPRPLLGISGQKDPINPLHGVELCEAAAKAAYAKAGVPDKFKLIIEANTAHNVTPEAQAAAIEWFSMWLKP
jgi:poly(3-hydroxybutyrate) depolymerase